MHERIGPTAFVGVRVLPMTGGPALEGQNVVVSDGRIAAVAPDAAVPDGATVVEGRGRTLIPGLCDMHVHIVASGLSDGPPEEAEALARMRAYLFVFLSSGVTTVRNMAGTPLHLRLRREVAEGAVPGPRIFTAGPILETRFTWPGLAHIGRLVRSVEEARETVRANHRDGYDFIKVYNDIDADIYDAIVDEARAVGLRVIGHVAFAKGLEGALAAGQASIEHLRSYDFAADTRPDPPGHRFEGWLHTDDARLDALAARSREAGVWNCPTLVTESGIGPGGAPRAPTGLDGLPAWLATMLAQSTLEGVFSEAQRRAIHGGAPARMRMVRALDRAGAGLLPGSDCPVYGLVPGRSLLRELELFVEAGLTPLRALESATVRSAEFLGIADETGTVGPGKRADLVLVEGNPAADIAALRRQAGTMAAGRWWPADALAARLAAFDEAA